MRKIGFISCSAVILFVLILNGCVSVSNSPNPKFYMLNSISKGQAVEKFEVNSGVIVAVGPIGLPEYLDRPQIVTRNKKGTLTFAQFDRWAEPLDTGLARLISDDLAEFLPAANLYVFPSNIAIPLDYQVVVDILQMDNQLEKDMTLTIQWSIIDFKNGKLLFTKRSQFIEPINPHDYFGLTSALSSSCLSLSQEIAKEISSLPRRSKSAR